MKKKRSLESILEQATIHGPQVAALGTRLSFQDAELLASTLKEKGLKVEPYDFPRTLGVWDASNADGILYRHLALKELIVGIARENGVDYKTFKGFNQILSYLTQSNVFESPINQWGTKLSGLGQYYGGSPSAAVLDLIATDSEFKKVRDMMPYDFPNAPNNIWRDKQGMPTEMARYATKQLVMALAKRKRVDYGTIHGFGQILGELARPSFEKFPINRWGTTLENHLGKAYKGSPSAAVLDLVYHDDDFVEVRNGNLQPYDFLQAPKNTWKDKKGKPTQTARDATKELVKALAERRGVDYRTVEGFRQLLPDFTGDSFEHAPINVFGTTIYGVLQRAYKSQLSAAVLDLVAKDNDFLEIRNANLQHYDFPNTQKWTKNGKPTQTARGGTKELVKVLAARRGVDYKSAEGFKTVLEELVEDSFRFISINRWGTKLEGMWSHAYGCRTSQAVLDLVANDDDFSEIRQKNLQPYDFKNAPVNTWVTKKGKPTDTARAVTKELVKVLAAECGVDYRTFSGFKKILEDLTQVTFCNHPINFWGTTAGSMQQSAYASSPSAAVLDLIKRDPEFKGLKGRINKDMLSGQTITREERAEGNYPCHMLRKALTAEGLDLSDYGFYSFRRGEKQTVREMLAEEAKSHFGESRIAYFGLEGPTFGSYFALAQKMNISVRRSLVAESDKRSYNVMRRISKSRKVNAVLNGNGIGSLELLLSSAEEALAQTAKKFDLEFLDWLGHLSPSRINELELAYAHLREGGMMAVTLNMAPKSETRYQRQTRFGISQDMYMKKWAEAKGLGIQDIDYVGGHRIRTPMKIYIMKRAA